MPEVSKESIKSLIEYVAGALVEQPKNVKVKQAKKENNTVMELTVSADDLGKVIGKNGQTARAIRTVGGPPWR